MGMHAALHHSLPACKVVHISLSAPWLHILRQNACDLTGMQLLGKQLYIIECVV